MKSIWAPWRIDFILGEKQMDCFLCEEPKKEMSQSSLVLAKTDYSFVIMNRYPYTNGHLLVSPYRHVSSPSMLNREEAMDLHELLVKSSDILGRVFSTDGINIGMNLGKAAGAGIEDHIHYHIIPRWFGDTNSMTTVGETRVIPEALEASYAKLAPYFLEEFD